MAKVAVKGKRSRVVLTLAAKAKILQDLDRGVPVIEIRRKYNIAESTAYDLKKNKVKIIEQIAQRQLRMDKRKTFKRAKYPLLDEALYIWFLQKRECHIPVSQDLLTVQATKLYEKLYKDGEFKGNRGYIVNFIKQHNIRFLKITGEKLSNNAAAVDTYIEHFAAFVRHLSPSQIFNADESGLYFKCTPSSTFFSMDESSAPGRKGNKERVTFMPCANVDGSLKLPLMMIGKSKRPRALKTSMSCPADELRTADGAFSTIFLPPNTTALLQPMDQNIIQMVKCNYKQKLMRELLGRQGEFDDMVKKINIKDAMFWVSEAWDDVPADSMTKSWKMLYREPEFDDEDDIQLSVVREILLSIQQKLAVQDITINEEDVEFDIVNIVMHPNTSFYDGENTFSIVEQTNISTESQQIDLDDEAENSVSNKTALSGIGQVIAWAKDVNDHPI
ncbi:jerky protein homolog-like [Armigeres subalbatus]|uniref:jerky protein homolog-like n=1 Tax=Armigeres subalbatus TaxID=124917 RepID=UPI002ED30A51